MHQATELIYSKMNASHLASAIDCVCKTFLLGEPLAYHLQMTEENFRPFIDQLLTHALKDELSWVAYDQHIGKVVGAFIITDLADDFQTDNLSDPKLVSAQRLIDKLWVPFAHEMNVPKGLVAHPYMGAVLPEYQRTGIINTICQFAYKDAWNRGYRKAIGEITSQYSLNLLRKNPHAQEINTIDYEDYEEDGKKIFAGMGIHKQCVLFSLPIEAIIPAEMMQPSANHIEA